MKKSNPHVMEEYLKMTLPHINWGEYELMSVETGPYSGPYDDTFKKQMIIEIQESDHQNGEFDKEFWYVHGYTQRVRDDRPMRDHALVIVERTKRRKHKETGEIKTSSTQGFTNFKTTTRAEDQLSFLK